MRAVVYWLGTLSVLLCAARGAHGRLSPDADHTVWVTIDSTPIGAEVYSVPQDKTKPMRVGATPCRVPVDLYWGTKWFVKRWERLKIESPGGIFHGEQHADGTCVILVRARLTKEGYVDQEVSVPAFTLNHPGKSWEGKLLWPREVRVHAELIPAQARRLNGSEQHRAVLRQVWVAKSESTRDVGAVVVWANVVGADVWVDGGRIAPAPVEIVLQEGEHVVEVRKPGYITARRSIVVVANGRLVYEAVLEREP